jgi:membrane-bound lytic murein transglycosylase D
MALLADVTEVAAAEIAAMNPAVLKSVAPADFQVHVPKGMGNRLLAAIETIPAEHRKSWRMHRVGAGETLAAIAKRYGSSPSGILAANRMEAADAAGEGDLLVIPAASRPASSPKAKPRVTTRRPTSTRKPAVSAGGSKPSPKPRVVASAR